MRAPLRQAVENVRVARLKEYALRALNILAQTPRWLWAVLSAAFVVAVIVALAVSAGLVWLAVTHPVGKPLSLDRWVPRLEAYLAANDVHVKVGHLEAWFDTRVKLRADDIEVYGKEGELGAVVQQLGVSLANRSLFSLQLAPKAVEASGLTVRLVKKNDRLQVAGLGASVSRTVPEEGAPDLPGLVEWLNDMTGDPAWGHMKRVTLDDVTLLLRDDDKQAEWVLEHGRAEATNFKDTGQEGVVNASLRRLYGAPTSLEQRRTDASGTLVVSGSEVDMASAMPVVLRFEHARGAEKMILSLGFRNADTAAVADYLPAEMASLIRGKGTIELGTTLDEANRLEEPWVRLDLADVEILPPKKFSKALVFPTLQLVATYQPSPTDVLVIRRLDAVYGTGKDSIRLVGRGEVKDVTTDPFFNIGLASPEGNVQRIFDFFPDAEPKLEKPLKWLRENIKTARYTTLRGSLVARVSDFPHCMDLCGIRLSARVQEGRVKFLETMPEVTEVSGTLKMVGQTLEVAAPKVRLGKQVGTNVVMRLTDMFSPSPTRVLVNAAITGDAAEISQELQELAKETVPGRLTGTHTSTFAVNVPLPKGRDARLDEIGILVDSRLTKLVVDQVDGLPGTFTSTSGTVVVDDTRTVRIWTSGKVEGTPTDIRVTDRLDSFGKGLSLSLKGALPAPWVAARLGATGTVSMTGALAGTMWAKQQANGWGFNVNTDASGVKIGVPVLNWSKPAGESLKVVAKGTYRAPTGVQTVVRTVKAKSGRTRKVTEVNPATAARVTLSNIALTGSNTDVRGTLDVWPAQVARSSVVLRPFRLGGSDVDISLVDQLLTVKGKSLDLSGVDVMGGNDKGKPRDRTFDRLRVNVDVATLLAKEGKLNAVTGNLRNRWGRWDVDNLKASVDGGGRIDIALQPIAGQRGRRRLTMDIQNAGQVAKALGFYDRLIGGRLQGEINYDSDEVGAGVLTLKDFELANPPILVSILSLVSLEQLLSGVGSIIFKEARVPLRLDGDLVWIDQMTMDGPSMGLRLNGSYDRVEKFMNIDGRLAPGIPLNRLVAKIPLIGTILTGSQDALVVVDFKLKGPSDDPNVTVRPLSVITPGLLKDVWRGITGSAPARPQPQVIDGRVTGRY